MSDPNTTAAAERVREAADRVRRIEACESVQSVYGTTSFEHGMREYGHDRTAVIDAYLAQQPTYEQQAAECERLEEQNHQDKLRGEAICLDWNEKYERLEGECERLSEKLHTIVSLLQRKLQPAGSPPPGDETTLAAWIIDEAHKQLTELRAAAQAFEDERLVDEEWCRANYGDPQLESGGTYYWPLGTFDQSWFADDRVTSVRLTKFDDDLFAVEMLSHDRSKMPSFWTRQVVFRVTAITQLRHLLAFLGGAK